MPPRFHVLTAGFKASIFAKQQDPLTAMASSPSPSHSMMRSCSTSSRSSLSNIAAQSTAVAGTNDGSSYAPQSSDSGDSDAYNTEQLKHEPDLVSFKTSALANKRKSRLGTTRYLSQRQALSDDERQQIQMAGILSWNYPASERAGKKIGFVEYYFTIIDGTLNRYQSKEKFEEGGKPMSTIGISNALTFISDSPINPGFKRLRVLLVEDNETHLFEKNNDALLQDWKSVIGTVAYRWGAAQKDTLEHEVAYLRKQLGMLWEMCQNGLVPPKIQKRMTDVTTDMQVKDDLLADVIARQEKGSSWWSRIIFGRLGDSELVGQLTQEPSSSDEELDSQDDDEDDESKDSSCNESMDHSINLFAETQELDSLSTQNRARVIDAVDLSCKVDTHPIHSAIMAIPSRNDSISDKAFPYIDTTTKAPVELTVILATPDAKQGNLSDEEFPWRGVTSLTDASDTTSHRKSIIEPVQCTSSTNKDGCHVFHSATLSNSNQDKEARIITTDSREDLQYCSYSETNILGEQKSFQTISQHRVSGTDGLFSEISTAPFLSHDSDNKPLSGYIREKQLKNVSTDTETHASTDSNIQKIRSRRKSSIDGNSLNTYLNLQDSTQLVNDYNEHLQVGSNHDTVQDPNLWGSSCESTHITTTDILDKNDKVASDSVQNIQLKGSLNSLKNDTEAQFNLKTADPSGIDVKETLGESIQHSVSISHAKTDSQNIPPQLKTKNECPLFSSKDEINESDQVEKIHHEQDTHRVHKESSLPDSRANFADVMDLKLMASNISIIDKTHDTTVASRHTSRNRKNENDDTFSHSWPQDTQKDLTDSTDLKRMYTLSLLML
ncbi:hypothetical protein BASA60_001021 [Batrachochytrium salamandrivorans]|nr:hypothetical protein BASA60_001021 [Batrachochytrium salamandrivorans]